jgi:hypothetical protein
LAASVIAAALALAVSSESAPRSVGAGIVVGPELLLDPNTAPPRVLETLPHVGRTLVLQIVAARDDRPFTSLDDARRRVRGLGPATLAMLAPYLSIDGRPPRSAKQRANPDGIGAGARSRSKARRKSSPEAPSVSSSRLAVRFPDLVPFQDITMAHNE